MHRSSFLLAALVVFLLTGCTALRQLSSYQDARRHMAAASRMEAFGKIREAALKYTFVAENYPASVFCKTAIFKAAMLWGIRDNPDRNLKTSLYWLNEYLKQSLSEQEQASAGFLIAMIEEVKLHQDRAAEFQIELQNRRAVNAQNEAKIDYLEQQDKQQQTKINRLREELVVSEEKVRLQDKQSRQLEQKLSLYQDQTKGQEEQIKRQEEQIRQLEAEIDKTQKALERLKEIDVKIHKSRLK